MIKDKTKNEMIEDSTKDNRKDKRKIIGFIGSFVALAFGSSLISSALGFLTRKDENKKQNRDKNKKQNRDKKRPKWAMVIDLDLCTGCGACAIACKVENNIPFTGYDEKMFGAEISWMTILETEKGFLPLPCFHCDNPPCTKVCPVGATYINEEGIVMQIWDRCIGCRYCQVACPYERKYFVWTKPHWPETYKQWFNPDVATRPKGVVEKCTFCAHRLRNLKEKVKDEDREIKDEEVRYLPACAETCPTRAIIFGDISNPESIVSQLAKSPRAFRIEESLGTEPKVIYLAKEKRKYITEGGE